MGDYYPPQTQTENFTGGCVLTHTNFQIMYPSNWDEKTVKNRRFRGRGTFFQARKPPILFFNQVTPQLPAPYYFSLYVHVGAKSNILNAPGPGKR